MYLRTQDDDAIVDLDKFTAIVAEDGKVFINMYDGNSLLAGEYKDQERAKEVLQEIYATLDVMSRYEMPIV